MGSDLRSIRRALAGQTPASPSRLLNYYVSRAKRADFFGELKVNVPKHALFNRLLGSLGGFLTLALSLPLGKVLEIEGDEGFELNKAFLQNQGFKLYSEIWDDQPPFYTTALTTVFRMCGPSILGARLLTTCFSLILLTALYGCVSQKFDRWTGCAAVALLATAPRYLSLSVSVMKEVPAFSMALTAAWALYQWEKQRSWQWLTLSGVLFGMALMIKFSAGLILPAALVEIFLATQGATPRCRMLLQSLAVWLAGALGTAVALCATLGFGGFSLLISTHVSVQQISVSPQTWRFPFPDDLLCDSRRRIFVLCGRPLACLFTQTVVGG